MTVLDRLTDRWLLIAAKHRQTPGPLANADLEYAARRARGTITIEQLTARANERGIHVT